MHFNNFLKSGQNKWLNEVIPVGLLYWCKTKSLLIFGISVSCMFTFSLLRCVGSEFPVQTAEIVKITNFVDFCNVYNLKIIVSLITCALSVLCNNKALCESVVDWEDFWRYSIYVSADREEGGAVWLVNRDCCKTSVEIRNCMFQSLANFIAVAQLSFTVSPQ